MGFQQIQWVPEGRRASRGNERHLERQAASLPRELVLLGAQAPRLNWRVNGSQAVQTQVDAGTELEGGGIQCNGSGPHIGRLG